MPYYTSRTNRLPSSPSPENTVTEPEDITRGDLKYELSLKTKILDDIFGNNGDFWMGYTQVSHWQIFNAERSRPFRETNYEPDANLVFRTDYDVLGWKARLLAIGLVHQSNGRSNPLSRSWNRATATIGLERENWTITLSRSSALPATHSLHCCCATRCAAASAVTVPCNSTGHSRSRRRCADMCRCSTAMARA
jgi:phospholipase A1